MLLNNKSNYIDVSATYCLAASKNAAFLSWNDKCLSMELLPNDVPATFA